MFARILRVRYTVAKLKVEIFQQAVTEIVALDHTEILHWLCADCKLDTDPHSESGAPERAGNEWNERNGNRTINGLQWAEATETSGRTRNRLSILRCAHSFQLQKLRRKLIAHISAGVRINVVDVFGRVGYHVVGVGTAIVRICLGMLVARRLSNLE